MWPIETRRRAEGLLRDGYSLARVAACTDVPLSTLRRWHRPGARPLRSISVPSTWRPDDPGTYCYLLGVYLGDGHIVWGKNSGTIGIALDAAYPSIVVQVERALAGTFPEARVRTYRYRDARKVGVFLSSPLLRLAFPQHGPGKKHERPIELVPWQRELTHKWPELLLRGLIHSDGCRTVNRFRTRLPSGRVATYEYPRYFFTNLSADIRRVFCEHCELLGVRWTQSNARNISVSHRDSVALLDSFVGPKA